MFNENCCPTCNAENIEAHTTYTTQTGEQRVIYHCQDCRDYFSETKNTPLAGLRTPLSKIKQVIDALNDGMGINAAARTFNVAKNTIYDWLERMAGLKEVLLLYALCHQFLTQVVEGDELYTKVKENKAPDQSEGWTIVLMERASRFIWELQCGPRERELFQAAMETLKQVIEQTGELTLVTDGERRYGTIVFEICRQALRTGKVGRPRQILPKGVKVRVKNKGSQAHKTGPKQPRSRNTPTRRKIWPTRTFTPIIWRASMPVYAASWLASGDAPTPMPNKKKPCKSGWMFTGYFTISCDLTLPPSRYLRLLWASWRKACLWLNFLRFGTLSCQFPFN
jgi:transposase-like protein